MWPRQAGPHPAAALLGPAKRYEGMIVDRRFIQPRPALGEVYRGSGEAVARAGKRKGAPVASSDATAARTARVMVKRVCLHVNQAKPTVRAFRFKGA